MKFLRENGLLIVALLISIAIHAGILIFFSKIEKVKTTKKEEKPIIISLVNTKETSKTSSIKRKIPRKTKVNSPKKSTKPFSSKNSTNKSKPVKQKNKTLNKLKKSLKKENKPKTFSEKIIKNNKPPEKKQPLAKEKKKIIPIKNDIPIKKEGKKLQIASKNTENKIKNVPKLSTPPPENNKAKEEKPPQQLNISHLKGKDEIYQMGNKNKKETKTPKKDKDILKYLYKVRDKLQENLAYPLMAKRLEIEGTVIVRFIINPDGSVDKKTIKVVKSSGSNILDKQAIITVKNSLPFEPTPNKKKVVVEIPVIFEIIRSYD